MNKMITSTLIVGIFGFQSLFAMAGGPNPTQQLLLGAATGNLAQVQAALNQGADINATGGAMQDTALIRAVDNNNYAVVEYLLLEHGADPNIADITGWTPLHVAVSRLLPAVVKLLLDKGADPTLRNNVDQIPAELLQFLPLAQQNQPNAQQIRQYFEETARSTLIVW